MTITITLHGLVPPAEPTLALPVTWYRDAAGELVLQAARVSGGYSWRVSTLRGRGGSDQVGLPGGLWVSGVAAALEALDRGEVPAWQEPLASSAPSEPAERGRGPWIPTHQLWLHDARVPVRVDGREIWREWDWRHAHHPSYRIEDGVSLESAGLEPLA